MTDGISDYRLHVLNLFLVNFITWHQKYKIKTYNVVCVKTRTILVVDNNNKKWKYSCHMTTSNITNAVLYSIDLTTEIWKPLSVVHLPVCCVFHFCILPTGPKASSALVNTSSGSEFISTYFRKQAWCAGRLTWLIVKEAFQIPMLSLKCHIFSAFSKTAKILWSKLMLRPKNYF